MIRSLPPGSRPRWSCSTTDDNQIRPSERGVSGANCWLGAGVVVLPGVTIGDNCVIGAGSVVTRDIPANSFAAGVPCRVIRTLSEQDSMRNHPEILQDCAVPEKE